MVVLKIGHQIPQWTLCGLNNNVQNHHPTPTLTERKKHASNQAEHDKYSHYFRNDYLSIVSTWVLNIALYSFEDQNTEKFLRHISVTEKSLVGKASHCYKTNHTWSISFLECTLFVIWPALQGTSFTHQWDPDLHFGFLACLQGISNWSMRPRSQLCTTNWFCLALGSHLMRYPFYRPLVPVHHEDRKGGT
jgi:hypothetical protein